MEWGLRLKDEQWKVLCQKALGFGLVYPLHIHDSRGGTCVETSGGADQVGQLSKIEKILG